MIDIEQTDYKIKGVPYKIAVADVQNVLVAKLKAIMHEIALKREVDPEEQDLFTKMLKTHAKRFQTFRETEYALGARCPQSEAQTPATGG